MNNFDPKNPNDFFGFFSHTAGTAFTGVNDKIACQPFVDHLQTQGKNFMTVKQKNSCMGTKVLFSTAEFRAGDTIYIRGDATTLPETKEVFEWNGVKFVLLSKHLVQFVVRPLSLSAFQNLVFGKYKALYPAADDLEKTFKTPEFKALAEKELAALHPDLRPVEGQ